VTVGRLKVVVGFIFDNNDYYKSLPSQTMTIVPAPVIIDSTSPFSINRWLINRLNIHVSDALHSFYYFMTSLHSMTLTRLQQLPEN